jgi:asparagine synthase (glutamine-hydrolysing)
MCGICGIVRPSHAPPVDQEQLFRMHKSQLHRGQDDSGFYINGTVGLASQRLSILDLSPRGHMPMSSHDGRYWIVHNGEVYNYRELRKELEREGHHFKSNTDTEVVLELFRREGPAMLAKCNGMFAFAIWDSEERSMFIARDRQGVKPLVYVESESALIFASEEKALIAGGIPAEFDYTTWEELLYFRYVAGAKTPFKGIKRLLPGHYLLWKEGTLTLRCWWSLPIGMKEKNAGTSFDDAVSQLRGLFEDSIRFRRISDVPVGVLLSGGLDSSAMTAVMARQQEEVSSFTVRFNEPKYDEGELAQLVARKWKVKTHELFVPHDQIPELLEDATRFLDAPIVHNNDLHLLAIARFAKPLVTVLLSGEGSDETFGGYVRYRLFHYAWAFSLLRRLPFFIPPMFDRTGRLRKSARLLRYGTLREAEQFASAEVLPFEIGLTGRDSDMEYRRQLIERALQSYADPVRQVMFYEQNTYLQSILDRNDRMTMGASIECREPFLDYRIVEWAARLPTPVLTAGGLKKMVLRKAVAGFLPLAVLSHPKWGFATPLPAYLRSIDKIRRYLLKLPASEFIRSAPLKQEQIEDCIHSFLAGDDECLPLVRQLLMTSVWYEVCVQGRRGVFE